MRAFVAALLFLAASALPLAAHADTTDLFTLTQGSSTESWTLPALVNFSYPIGIPQFLPTFPITLVSNGASTNTSVTFEYGHPANLIVGGQPVYNIPSVLNTTSVGSSGTDNLYTGTFDLGTFGGFVMGLSSTGFPTEIPATLTISQQATTPTPTPEPSSLLLLATGLLGATPLLRRRLPRV